MKPKKAISNTKSSKTKDVKTSVSKNRSKSTSEEIKLVVDFDNNKIEFTPIPEPIKNIDIIEGVDVTHVLNSFIEVSEKNQANLESQLVSANILDNPILESILEENKDTKILPLEYNIQHSKYNARKASAEFEDLMENIESSPETDYSGEKQYLQYQAPTPTFKAENSSVKKELLDNITISKNNVESNASELDSFVNSIVAINPVLGKVLIEYVRILDSIKKFKNE